MTAKQLSATLIVVLLTDMTVQGDLIPVDTVIEVERAIRNDWKGSGLCRDATDEEIAEYRGQEQAADGFDGRLQGDQAQLLADVERLQDRKAELTGDLEALEGDLEQLGTQHTDLQAELAGMVEQRDTLADEVKALEKAKAGAAKK